MNRSTRFWMPLFCLLLTAAMAPAAYATICIAPDDGSGTATMPPAANPGNSQCTTGYVSPTEFHMIIAGLPAGTEITIGPEHSRFINVVATAGGPLGGQTETFDSNVILQMTGNGDLTGFSRTISMNLAGQTATGPRTPGDAVQTFPNEMVQLQGNLSGDPDFDQLQIRVGSGLGLPPSTGQTTLTRLGPPGSSFNVDSFFDIVYTIDYVGAPGGALDGLSGSTQGTVRMQLGEATQATPASGRLAVLITMLALALLVPLVWYMRRARTA